MRSVNTGRIERTRKNGDEALIVMNRNPLLLIIFNVTRLATAILM